MALGSTKPASCTTFHHYLQYLLDLIIIKIKKSVCTYQPLTILLISYARFHLFVVVVVVVVVQNLYFIFLYFVFCIIYLYFFVNFGEECGIYLEKC